MVRRTENRAPDHSEQRLPRSRHASSALAPLVLWLWPLACASYRFRARDGSAVDAGAFAMSWMKRLQQILLASGVFLAGCGGAHGLVSGTDAAAEAPRGTDTAVDAPHPRACESTSVDAAISSAVDARAPVNHRPTPACCTSERGAAPAGQPYPPGVASTCTSDSQCTAGANGRCFPFEGLVGNGGCSYDECFTDSDCGSGATCLCRSSLARNSANVCVRGGNCVVDSDCGPGNYCSPSLEQNCASPRPNFCHTAMDACMDDSDCLSVDAGAFSCPTLATCAFDTQERRWTCIQVTCCPP